MNSNPPAHLKLGDYLNAIVVKPIGGRRFALKCKGVPDGWAAELHSRRPDTISPGMAGTFWVAKISPLQGAVLLHDGDFGRLPISDAMRTRYLSALTALLGDGEATGDQLADARSMVMRIEKKDQADWLSVWRVFGEPGTGDVKQLLAAINAIRTARSDDAAAVPACRAALVEKYGELLQIAVGRLMK